MVGTVEIILGCGVHRLKTGLGSQSAPRPVILSKKPSWSEIAVEETDLSLYDELFSDAKDKGGDA